MSAGLYQTLSVGAQSLYASRQGLDTTAHNIANAQTDGYSRQTVHLQQRDPIQSHEVIIGNGAYVGNIKRSHDFFTEQQLASAGSSLGDSEARSAQLANLEALFNPELRATVAQEMSMFFEALQTLSNFPEEISARTAVREQAKSLVSAFQGVDFDLRRFRTHANEALHSQLNEVNDIIANISDLNGQIRTIETGIGNKANDLRDQRDRLVRQLSERMNISYYDDTVGMVTIRGPREVLLVDRSRAAKLTVQNNASHDGMFDIISTDSEGGSSRNITKGFTGGQIKGLLDVRDQVAGRLLEQNNDMAYRFGQTFNDVHKTGYGLESYRDISNISFFTGLEDKNLAARSIDIDQVIINTTDAIAAASTPNAPGDNVILNQLVGLKSEKLMAGETANFNDFYANCVGVLGIETLRARNMLDSDKVVMGDLKSRRETIAGVSLDEEATHMMRWQTAFTASSKVITAVDEMMETILNLKR